MKATVTPLAYCCHPRCPKYAIYSVNLPCFTDYMAHKVCENHVDWAEEKLHKYIPTDR